MDFYHQEFSVILGHNGAGKSCFLKMITGIIDIFFNHFLIRRVMNNLKYIQQGMYKPTHGHIYLKGRDYNEDESFAGLIGYCPQENILVNYFTTLQHLYIFGMVNI